jgi:hypothetical protein
MPTSTTIADEIDLAAFFRHGVPTIATQEHLQNAETVLLIGSDPTRRSVDRLLDSVGGAAEGGAAVDGQRGAVTV